MNKIRTNILGHGRIIILIAILGAAITKIFNVSEILIDMVGKYEIWQVNELINLIIILHLGFAILSWRWLQAARYEISQSKPTKEIGSDSEAKYLFLFESNPLPMWVYDVQTLKFLAVNDAAIYHYGYSRQEFLEMTIQDIRPADKVPHLLEVVREEEVGLNQAGIWKHRKKDGTIIDVKITWQDLTFANKPARLVLAKEITQCKAAGEALARSELLYRKLAQNFPNGAVLLFDPKLRYTIAEGKGLATVGLSKEFLEGKTIWEVWPPEIWELLEPNYQAAFAGRESSLEVPYAGRIYLVQVLPVKNEQGEIFAGMVVSQDITSRKHSEESLQESEARFCQLAENIQEVFFINALRKLKTLYISPAYEKIWGRTCQSLYEQSNSFLDTVHPEDRDRVLTLMAKQRQGEDVNYEYRIVRPDGSVRWIWDRSFVVTDQLNQPYRIYGIAKDITERQLAEQALRESEAQIRLIADAIPAYISYIDPELRYRFVNKAYEKWFGIPAKEIIGKHVREIKGEATYQQIQGYLKAVLAGEKVTYQNVQTSGDGEQHYLQVAYIPHVGEAEKVLGFFVFVQDITQHQQAEAALQRANDELETKVEERTTQLREAITTITQANAQLQQEITERKQTSSALQESEERWKAIAANIPGTVYRSVLHARGKLEFPFVSAGWKEMTGLEPSEIMANPELWHEMIHPDDRIQLDELKRTAREALQPFEREYRFISKSGEIKWVQDRVRFFRTDNGDIVGDGVALDITARKQAEAALRESEARLSAIAANIPGIVYRGVVHPDGKIALPFVSAGVGEIYGLNPEEAMADPEQLLATIHPEDQMQVDELRKAEKKNLKLFHKEYRIVCKSGEVKWLQDSGRYSTDSDGNVVLDGVALDITERKRIEEALRQSEERFCKAFHANPVACSITTFPEGRFLDVNDSFLKISGYQPQEVIGRTSTELGLWPRQSDRASLIEMLHQQQSVRDIELQLCRKSGEIRHGLASFEIIDLSAQTCVLSMFYDITERQQVEAAMHQQHLRERLIGEIALRIRQSLNLDEILNTAVAEVRDFLQVERVAVFQSNGGFNGKFIVESVEEGCSSVVGAVIEDSSFNAQYLRMFQQGQIIAIDDIHTVERAPCYIEMLAGLQIRANLVVPIVFDCELWGLLCAHQCSQPRQWQPFEIDLLSSLATQLAIAIKQSFLFKQLNERTTQMEATNKELEAFSYSVSHDLRAPLRHIDGFSKILLEDCADGLDDTGKDYLNRVRAATQRMGQLIDDLLNLSRVTSAQLRRQRVDINTMARAIFESLKHGGPDRQVEFIIPEGLTAYGDERLLQILFENLLANAWKYTSKHQTARIEVGVWWHPAGYPVYFVRDDGAGFDMAYANKLFVAFQRLHTTSQFPGTGIGLAIVQRIIHRHGGSVWAESAVDQGATFYFTLGTGDY